MYICVCVCVAHPLYLFICWWTLSCLFHFSPVGFFVNTWQINRNKKKLWKKVCYICLNPNLSFISHIILAFLSLRNIMISCVTHLSNFIENLKVYTEHKTLSWWVFLLWMTISLRRQWDCEGILSSRMKKEDWKKERDAIFTSLLLL